jgi:hypothetical protein
MISNVIIEGMEMEAFKHEPDFNTEVYQKALNAAIIKVNKNLEKFTDKFPSSSTVETYTD